VQGVRAYTVSNPIITGVNPEGNLCGHRMEKIEPTVPSKGKAYAHMAKRHKQKITRYNNI